MLNPLSYRDSYRENACYACSRCRTALLFFVLISLNLSPSSFSLSSGRWLATDINTFKEGRYYKGRVIYYQVEVGAGMLCLGGGGRNFCWKSTGRGSEMNNPLSRGIIYFLGIWGFS